MPLILRNKVSWLERRDQTFLSEYVGRLTGPEGSATAQDVTGTPKYYSMFGGATGLSDTTSGSIYLAPTPDVNYNFRIYYNKMPTGLGSGADGDATTYVSQLLSSRATICLFTRSICLLKRTNRHVDII
jgi:hypothetical protein